MTLMLDNMLDHLFLCVRLCVQHHVRPSRVPGGVQSQSGTDAGQCLL